MDFLGGVDRASATPWRTSSVATTRAGSSASAGRAPSPGTVADGRAGAPRRATATTWRCSSTAPRRSRPSPPRCARRDDRCTSPAGRSAPTSPWSASRACRHASRAPRRCCRARRRARPGVGGRAARPLPPHPRRRRGRRSRALRGTRIRGAARRPQPPDALPPREARHRRRRHRIRRWHRPHRASAGIGTTALPHGERGTLGWHDAAARLRGPAVARRGRALRHALGGHHRRANPTRGLPQAAGTSRVQVVRTVPETHVRGAAQRRLQRPRGVRRRAARMPAASSTSRTSSCGAPSSSPCWQQAAHAAQRRVPALRGAAPATQQRQ